MAKKCKEGKLEQGIYAWMEQKCQTHRRKEIKNRKTSNVFEKAADFLDYARTFINLPPSQNRFL